MFHFRPHALLLLLSLSPPLCFFLSFAHTPTETQSVLHFVEPIMLYLLEVYMVMSLQERALNKPQTYRLHCKNESIDCLSLCVCVFTFC
uniref:Putative secreted protein n=1 Tax=Anopheles darlingi TaxID=43151 RepID=A0A2M4D3T4_ANODA